MQGKAKTLGQGESSPHKVPAPKKSGPPKPPMAAGATPKGKAAPGRGTPAKPLEEADGKKTGEVAPQGDSESSSYYYSESQSSETHAQGTERRAAEEKPRTPSGERPRTPPKPDPPRESSGRREQRSGSPLGGQPRPRPAPPQRDSPRQGRRTEIIQVIRSADRGAGRPQDCQPSPRESPRCRRSGRPERREPAAPRRGGRSHSRRRRRSPPQDSCSRSRRRSRSRGHDRHAYWPDRPRHRPAGEGGNEGAVQARRGQHRPYSPQGARRQREESLQDQRKAKGWHQNHGDRAGPNAAYWCGQNRHTEDPRPGGKGKSQSKGGGRRGKGSKARNRQHAQHGQPRTENQRRFQQRRDVHATYPKAHHRDPGPPGASKGYVVAAAAGPAKPMMEPGRRARRRPGDPLRPGPTARQGGSSESPGVADGGDLFPSPGARVFLGRDKTPVHRSPGFCGSLAPRLGGRDKRTLAAGTSGRQDHGWKKKVGALPLWKPGECEGPRPRRPPAGAPPPFQARGYRRDAHDPGSLEPPPPTGVPRRGAKCQCGGEAGKPFRMAEPFLRDVGPSHAWLRGFRIGEAANPGPTMVLPPWQPEPEYTSNFAVFGEGCVVFVFLGPVEGGGSMPSFRARAPSGDRLATFFAGGRDVFSDLRKGQAYVCAEARPVLPQVLESRQFRVGVQGSTTAVVGVRMAPSGLVWRTGLPREARTPWTHADLACGIGGFHSGGKFFRCVYRLGLRRQQGGHPGLQCGTCPRCYCPCEVPPHRSPIPMGATRGSRPHLGGLSLPSL